MKDFFSYLYTLLTTDIKIGNVHLSFNFLEILLKFVLPIVFSLFLYKFLGKWTRHGLNKTKLEEKKKAEVLGWFKLFYKAALTVSVFLLTINLLGAEINKYITALGKVLTHPIVEGISIVTILLILPILYLGRFLGRLTQKVANSSLLEHIKINIGTKQTLSAVIKNITTGIVILFGLTIIGIDLSLLFGLFGVVGFGLGFGLQGVVANLFAGLVLLTSKPVKVGDHIIVDDTEGNLQEIRFLNSIVSTISHESIIIPNSKLIENPVHNFSFDDESIIIKNSIQVDYKSDLDKVLIVLKSIVEQCPYRLTIKDVKARVVSFEDSGISLATICWIKESRFKYDALSWINLEIWRTFKKEGVQIPFPQLDLHLIKKSLRDE